MRERGTRRAVSVVALGTLLACGGVWAQSAQATAGTDAEVENFAPIDGLVAEAIAEHRLPGAVVEIGHDGRVVFRKAYGWRSLEPDREPMTADTIFDMASLTKPLVTALAVMQLYQEGKIAGVDDPVAKYLPQFGANGKQGITIRELLTHYSGLPPDLSLAEPWSGKEAGFLRAYAVAPEWPPGTMFRYSDINFIVLQALVERLSGLPLQDYAEEKILEPLGLEHTRFQPPASWIPEIAPTQWLHGAAASGIPGSHTFPGDTMLRGVVHDPTARRMGGVAGHAGLFSDADDVGTYAQALLDRLAGRPSRFPLSRRVLEMMVRPEQPAGGTALRGFGWDIDSPYSSNRGTVFPAGTSFGHTGFTGTSLWMDPGSDTYVVLLANAVHPDGGKSITALRGAIADVAARAVGVQPRGDVRAGIDVLEGDDFRELATLALQHGGHLRLGLLTNVVGVDRKGRRTIDVLVHDAERAVPGLTLTMLFSPEHGLGGTAETGTVASGTDAATGLPVISLYGRTEAERRPPLGALRKLDAVAIDLQDAGVRFYTYETVVRYFLEAAARTGTTVVVLDRPDPVNGAAVQGPVSDPGTESYVNGMPIPVRPGLTLGELARYDDAVLDLHAPLAVVAMQGWRRGEWYDETGLVWRSPSPNLRDLEETTLYPGIGLVETTNVSVGRGTETPFEVVGAPWIDGLRLAAVLNGRKIAGVQFAAAEFTPEKPYPYGGELCRGVRMTVTDRNALNTPELGVEMAAALHRLYPKQFALDKMETLLNNRAVLAALEAGKDPRKMAKGWRGAVQRFEKERKGALLYGP